MEKKVLEVTYKPVTSGEPSAYYYFYTIFNSL